MNIRHLTCVAVIAGLLTGTTAVRAEDTGTFDTGMIPAPHILIPDGDVGATVVVISDSKGWADKEQALAESLKSKGTLVIGIDLPSYLASLEKDTGDCVYMVSDIESLSQQVQRAAKKSDYGLPIVAGVGAGGALALAIAAQTPPTTIAATVAVDPEAGIALMNELCTPADKTVKGNRRLYGLTDGPLPDPVGVTFTSAASADGKAHVQSLVAKHSDITVSNSQSDAWDAFETALSAAIDSLTSEDNPLGLPLTILDTTPTRDTVAIVYSGDGGWRDIDKEVGDVLQKEGMPVIGVDALRYFWSERQPQETADDLHKIITLYTKRWNVKHVLLIGYSFGADVLPRTYNLLPKADRDRIRQMSLLALSHQVDYKISVLGWLGASGDGSSGDPVEDLKTVDPSIIQCIYGTEDDDDACPALNDSGAEIIAIEGGHHFDEDYPALVKRILTSYDKRLAAKP